MSLPTHCMRIAVLINTSPDTPLEPYVRSSWKRALKAVEPTADIHFFDPVIAQKYPDPLDYDLIVLSGGSTDPRSDEPWVVKMRDFVREVAEGSTKLLGICWGHQVIAEALGGKVETMETGPIGDINEIQLTPEGKAFLGFPSWKSSFTAPEFHVRWVAKPVEGWTPLCEDNQAFLGNAGQIFTFQTHLEMDAATVEAITQNTKLYTEGKSNAEIQSIVQKAANGHGGEFILSKIVHWVYDYNDFA